MTSTRKSTATMVPRDMRQKRLQLVADEHGQLDMFRETQTTKSIIHTRKTPTHAAKIVHKATHVRSEIGAHSLLRVANDVLRTDEMR